MQDQYAISKQPGSDVENKRGYPTLVRRRANQLVQLAPGAAAMSRHGNPRTSGHSGQS
jgi:hypothetical protein